jgi:hypothetical protein
MVLENMSNKRSLNQKTSVEFQRQTEMLRGGLNTLYDHLVHVVKRFAQIDEVGIIDVEVLLWKERPGRSDFGSQFLDSDVAFAIKAITL